MSKPSTPPPARQITWLPKLDLSIHAAVSQTPEDRALVELLVKEWRDKLAAGVTADKLIHDPLQINAANEIEDGRHRFLAALRLDELHFLPCEVTTGTDAEGLVCEKLLQRRHYSKSARAYSLRHMAAKAAALTRTSRTANLVPGNKDGSRKPIESAFEKSGTLESLSQKSNLSPDLLQQAVKLERDYMARADALLTDWLALNPDEAESWQQWQDSQPFAEMPWSCWRSARLGALAIPDDAKSVNVIPKSWREIEEDKIFNGIQEQDGEDDDRRSYSLGSALKAMGSYFQTAGQQRSDLDTRSPLFFQTLINKVSSFTKTMWAKWSEVDPASRMEVIKQINASLPEWPEDVRRAVLVTLSKEAAQ